MHAIRAMENNHQQKINHCSVCKSGDFAKEKTRLGANEKTE